MRLNTQSERVYPKTHEGAPGPRLSPEDQLRRSVMACMLWEKSFYESGEDIVKRIYRLAQEVDPGTVGKLAVEARHEMKIRHAPLVLLSALAKTGAGRSETGDDISITINRVDELAEFLAVHAKLNGTTPDEVKPVLSNQMRKGLSSAFRKFDEYQLAKYDRPGPVKLRDVMNLCHAKPRDKEQAEIWDRLLGGRLKTPDTWEVAMSAGADRCETFTRLLNEEKLGYMALLKNLKSMVEAGVDRGLVRDALVARKGAHNVLPFRYIAAARACPVMEKEIDKAMAAALDELPVLPGKTVVLVDVSYSMAMDRVSKKSDMTRMDAACALATLVRSEEKEVYSFSSDTKLVPPREGMAMVDAIQNSQPNRNTYLGRAVHHVNDVGYDRLIVVTDEQSHDPVPGPKSKNAWMVNVGVYKNSVGHKGGWNRITGWSESLIRYISEVQEPG